MSFRGNRGFNLGPVEFLILANILFFIVIYIRFDLIYSLGLNPQLFPSRPWTILTSMFVHAGLWHIMTNMFTLYFFGRYVFSLIGEARFLIVYFVGGLLGGVFYLLLASPYSFAVGASGAVFALGGTLAVMRPNLKVIIFPLPVPIPLWVAIFGGFIIFTIFAILRFLPVAWEAHLGGLLFGVIMGYFFRRKGIYLL